MRIVVNCTSLSKGGGLRRATEFLHHLADQRYGHTWSIINSASTNAECNHLSSAFADWHVVAKRPSNSLRTRSLLAEIVDAKNYDRVFTFAGPAYCRFQIRHVMGWADGWVSHASKLAYQTLGLRTRLSTTLTSMYKSSWLKSANHWICQTETAKSGLHRRCGLSPSQISVIPNSPGSLYFNRLTDVPERNFGSDGTVRILVFAADHPHKRLELVPEIARILKARAPHLRFEFTLTLPQLGKYWHRIRRTSEQLGVANNLVNVGTVPSRDGPALYENHDICFLPSILETASGTYLESMCMQLPIVTTDLGFARESCQLAAEFFEPDCPRDAADRLMAIIENVSLRSRLVKNGIQVVTRCMTTDQQVKEVVAILES